MSMVAATGRVAARAGNGASASVALKAEHRAANDDTQRTGGEYLAQLRQLWGEAAPICDGDAAHEYLRTHQVLPESYPRCLRLHPRLPYFEKVDGKRQCTGTYPALLSCVQDRAGQPMNLWRDYLCGAGLAPVPRPRKPLLPFLRTGAVRLYPAQARSILAVTVDVDAALAVHHMCGWPTWAALTVENLRQLEIPQMVDFVVVFAATDVDCRELAAAYAFAERLKAERHAAGRLEIHVDTPDRPGFTYLGWLAELRELGMQTAAERQEERRRRAQANRAIWAKKSNAR